MTNFGSVIQEVGGAVSDLFTSRGNAAQAADYTGAASLATQNAQLAATSTKIQETQVARSVTQSLGATQADVAGAGFTTSGSALDLLRSSASQGSLAKALVNIQGAINENSYAAQAGAYAGEAKAAGEAANAGKINAIASIGGALVNNAGDLLSAGKTVVQGVKYVANSIFGNPSTATQFTGNAATVLTNGLPSSVPTGGFASLTDNSISAGASIGLDTSDPGLLGSAISDVSTTVGNAFDYISSNIGSAASYVASSLGFDTGVGQAIGSVIPGIGQVLEAAQLGSFLNKATGTNYLFGVSQVDNFITSAASKVTNGIVSVVSGIGHAIGRVFGSVICTALYKRGMLTRPVWNGAQRYGRDIAPPHIYRAYLLWGRPVANAITNHLWFARMVAPVFVPWANELAVLAGEKTAVSTAFGRTVFRVTYVFSFLLGNLLYRKEVYAEA